MYEDEVNNYQIPKWVPSSWIVSYNSSPRFNWSDFVSWESIALIQPLEWSRRKLVSTLVDAVPEIGMSFWVVFLVAAEATAKISKGGKHCKSTLYCGSVERFECSRSRFPVASSARLWITDRSENFGSSSTLCMGVNTGTSVFRIKANEHWNNMQQ